MYLNLNFTQYMRRLMLLAAPSPRHIDHGGEGLLEGGGHNNSGAKGKFGM